LDINVTGKQPYWIKYKTRSHEKMKKKKNKRKILVKIEDIKMHRIGNARWDRIGNEDIRSI